MYLYVLPVLSPVGHCCLFGIVVCIYIFKLYLLIFNTIVVTGTSTQERATHVYGRRLT